MRMKPKIQGMQNAAGAGHAEEGFEMAGMIPHHGGDAVTGLQTEFRQGGGEPARAPVEVAITGAPDGLVRFAGDDLDARENFAGTLQNSGQRQRKIHHRAAHRASRVGSKFGRMLSLNRCKGERRG